MELEVLDMPKWKEKVIYLVLRLLGYKDQHFLLLDIPNDTVAQPEKVEKIVWEE